MTTILTAVAVILGVTALMPRQVGAQWIPPRIEIDTVVGDGWSQTILHFPNGERRRLDLHRGTYLGFMGPENRPYLILSGYHCTECDADPFIILYAPNSVSLRLSEIPRYWWPGPVTSEDDTTQVIADSRLFYGVCLPSDQHGVVQFRSQLDSIGVMRTEVLATVITESGLVNQNLTRVAPPLSAVLNRVARGECTEIKAGS